MVNLCIRVNYFSLSTANETCESCVTNYQDGQEKDSYIIPEIYIPVRGDMEEEDLDAEQSNVTVCINHKIGQCGPSLAPSLEWVPLVPRHTLRVPGTRRDMVQIC